MNVPAGHVALAALTQPSQRPLDTFIVAPLSSGVSVNFDVPDAPVVVAGLPPQNSIEPAMPPQTVGEGGGQQEGRRVVKGSYPGGHVWKRREREGRKGREALLFRRATSVSWVLRFLEDVSGGDSCVGFGREVGGSYTLGSLHVVVVTAAGLTVSLARASRSWAGLGAGRARAVERKVRRERERERKCIFGITLVGQKGGGLD